MNQETAERFFASMLARLACPRRKWKAHKRRELRAIRKALDTFRLGCYHTPCQPEAAALTEILDEMTHKLSVEEWGR